MTKKRLSADKYRYDVCLSFAGEDRSYVEKVAAALCAAGVRVFYDDYEKTNLWGRDLYEHLDDVYTNMARFCVLFASANYAKKLWTTHERASAQSRAFRENREYVLPARLDDTKIPGIRDTVGYIDLRKTMPKALAQMIVEKLGQNRRTNYLPPMPDILLGVLAERYGSTDPVLTFDRATHFMESLQRTELEEREVILQAFMHGCTTELPKNVHVNVDFLCRLSSLSEAKLLRVLGKLRSLGFYSRVRKSRKDKHLGEGAVVVIEWHDMNIDSGTHGNATVIAAGMIQAQDFSHCSDCSLEAMRRLDFSHLSTATLKPMEMRDAETARKIRNPVKMIRELHPLRLNPTTRGPRKVNKE